jgi:protein-S-isoprenylcysteine O-methyltransferase Ste14
VEYKNKRICVAGKIEDYRGVPEIEAREPGHIKLQQDSMTLLKSLIFLIVVPGLFAIYVPLALLRRGARIETGAIAYLSFPLWLIGGIVLLKSLWNFSKEGRGTPAPIDPPKELVATGFYRYVRNPMYIAMISILIGHFLWFGFWLLLAYAATSFTGMHLFVALYEEPTLKKKFGTAYLDYVQAVPRWIPRLKKK